MKRFIVFLSVALITVLALAPFISQPSAAAAEKDTIRVMIAYQPGQKGAMQRLLNGATNAIRWTKVLLNMELKRVAHSVMDAGIAYESVAVRSADHREGVQALIEKRKPVFGRGATDN